MIANAKDFTITERHGDLAIARKHVGRKGWTVIRMSGNTMVVDLAHRKTESEIRETANRIWKDDHR